jgi:hypothetical protein
MAEEHVEETTESEESNGNGNGNSNGHQIGRMAVIAAASGATAYAAKKALESRSSSSSSGSDAEGEGSGAGTKSKAKGKNSSKKRAETSASLVGAAVSSGWDVAKDSLVPIIEDAATKAGGYAADRSPEVVRDVVIPRFISGFEKARGQERGDKSDAA